MNKILPCVHSVLHFGVSEIEDAAGPSTLPASSWPTRREARNGLQVF